MCLTWRALYIQKWDHFSDTFIFFFFFRWNFLKRKIRLELTSWHLRLSWRAWQALTCALFDMLNSTVIHGLIHEHSLTALSHCNWMRFSQICKEPSSLLRNCHVQTKDSRILKLVATTIHNLLHIYISNIYTPNCIHKLSGRVLQNIALSPFVSCGSAVKLHYEHKMLIFSPHTFLRSQWNRLVCNKLPLRYEQAFPFTHTYTM